MIQISSSENEAAKELISTASTKILNVIASKHTFDLSKSISVMKLSGY
jgi:hypothetical protein